MQSTPEKFCRGEELERFHAFNRKIYLLQFTECKRVLHEDHACLDVLKSLMQKHRTLSWLVPFSTFVQQAEGHPLASLQDRAHTPASADHREGQPPPQLSLESMNGHMIPALPRERTQSWAVVAHVVNPSTRGAEAGGSL